VDACEAVARLSGGCLYIAWHCLLKIQKEEEGQPPLVTVPVPAMAPRLVAHGVSTSIQLVPPGGRGIIVHDSTCVCTLLSRYKFQQSADSETAVEDSKGSYTIHAPRRTAAAAAVLLCAVLAAASSSSAYSALLSRAFSAVKHAGKVQSLLRHIHRPDTADICPLPCCERVRVHCILHSDRKFPCGRMQLYVKQDYRCSNAVCE